MNIPENALALAKPFEGFSPVVYLCPAGFPTIGYGHRCSKDHPPITHEEGETYLIIDMQHAVLSALKYCPVLATDKNKLGAIADFVFNLGAGRLQASTLRRRINQRNWPEAKKELNKWIYGGGKKLPGLVLRRKSESAFL